MSTQDSNSMSIASANLFAANSHLPLGNFIPDIKLDDRNFLIWKAIILAFLEGHELGGYVLGTEETPSATIQSNNGTPEIRNPEYDKWLMTDQSLRVWLLGSMTPSIACHFVDLHSSREVWNAVEEFCGALNRAKIKQLKTALKFARKDETKMYDYLKRMQQLSDSLAIAGEPISTNYLNAKVLLGLKAEYLPIIHQLNRKVNMSWPEFPRAIMSFEIQRLIISRGDGEITCQICGGLGHTADVCDHRYDDI